MENRSTDHKNCILGVLLLLAFGFVCAGCSTPLMSAPKLPKKKNGPNSFEKTWVTLFGSTNDFEDTSQSNQASDSQQADRSAFDENYDFSQLVEKSLDPQPSVKVKEQNKNQKSQNSSTKMAEPAKEELSQEHNDTDGATTAQMEKLNEIFSQDIWTTNVELQTWLEKQAENGEVPNIHSLIAKPNDPNQKKKTNFYAQLNAAAGSKIRPGNDIQRSAEAAKEGPISLNRWYHGPVEDLLLNMESLETGDAHRLKLLAAKVLAASPERSIAETNAAIFLARLDVQEAKPFLYESLQNDGLSPNLRAAAAEAFAQLDSTQNEEIIQLIAKYSERTDRLQKDAASHKTIIGDLPQDDETQHHETGITSQFAQKTKTQFHPGVPILVIDLLQSLATRIPPTDAECFTTALESRSAAIRLATVRIWRNHLPTNDGTTCPDEILKLTTDPNDERIRIAAMTVAARWNHPQAMRHLLDGVNDMHISIRLAAINALGIIGGEESVRCLLQRAQDPSPKVRSRVAASLRKLNEKESLYRFADDKSSEVRNEVAKGLNDPTVYNTTGLVEKMLADQSSQVQKSTLEAIRNWPLELSASILFGEMKSTSLLKRETATRVLAEKWPQAASFEFADRHDVRANTLAELKKQYYSEQTGLTPLPMEAHEEGVASFDSEDAERLAGNNETGLNRQIQPDKRLNPIRQVSWTQANPRSIDRITLDKGREAISLYFDEKATREERDRAKEQMLSLDEKLTLVVEYLAFNENRWIPNEIYRDILPQNDSVFLSIGNLSDENTTVRRKSAEEIYDKSQRRPLGPLVVSRVYEAGVREKDTITLITLFKVFESAPGEIADQFAKSFLDNDHPEIRRRACLALGQSENLLVLQELLPMIDDTSPEVVRTTLGSLGKLAAVYFDDDDENIDLGSRHLITDPIRKILLRNEVSLQIAASEALVRWRDTTGYEAFHRLAGSRDDRTRLAVAQTLGKLDDPDIAHVLISLLDDKRGSVRQAALNSLPELVGTDYGNPDNAISVSIPVRIQAWKTWASRSNREHDKIGHITESRTKIESGNGQHNTALYH